LDAFLTTITTVEIAAAIVVGVVAVPVALVLRVSTLAVTALQVCRIHARTCIAKLLLYRSTFDRFVTTVAPIIAAATIVVAVVAYTIAHSAFHITCTRALVNARIQALARCVHCAFIAVCSYEGFLAAVAAIPLTVFDVVAGVTIAIALVVRQGARRWLVVRIQALARCVHCACIAVCCFEGFLAAVAAIPLTVCVVVAGVTIAISLPIFILAFRTNRPLRVTIEAQTIGTVCCFDFGQAAISAVPGAPGIVVFVVTVAVPLILFESTGFFGLPHDAGCFDIVFAIQAQALVAVACVDVVATAGASVPIACSVVIFVVANTVCAELHSSA